MRIRQVRTQQQKTLRDVESASGFSSTHISEIERGRTSPTIGALIQIAHALEKDPSYFIEERELDEVCVTSMQHRPEVDPAVFDMTGTGLLVESLTTGILGGRLMAYELTLHPGAHGRVTRLPEGGDVCLNCIEGSFVLASGGKRLSLERDDSVHANFEDQIEVSNPGSEIVHVLVVLDPGQV
jgi:transcriptional regulator with XRE-family HTH domain